MHVHVGLFLVLGTLVKILMTVCGIRFIPKTTRYRIMKKIGLKRLVPINER